MTYEPAPSIRSRQVRSAELRFELLLVASLLAFVSYQIRLYLQDAAEKTTQLAVCRSERTEQVFKAFEKSLRHK